MRTVSACGIKPTGAKLLIAALKENRSLTEFNVKQNKLRIEDKQAIVLLAAGLDGRLNVEL